MRVDRKHRMDSLSHLIEQLEGLKPFVDGHLILGLTLLLNDQLGLRAIVGGGLGYWHILCDGLLMDLLLLHGLILLLLRLMFQRFGLGDVVAIGRGRRWRVVGLVFGSVVMVFSMSDEVWAE